eukprot:CAMPEP_0201622642 /NCGR_PEP_ID=MMETSP0492-20130828/47498_1 /ASSEMBLY_ACC=CAM_ASM_000837 /TAXON_ID=420259 /ORGANISM="Thalassiosira gravida, Strain GMp14c1" /LENGTH=245 /DNA_ID=CAMNT_0048092231 /DNA_START=27 /DNA_END=764 /DNA_ORIENTATION=-
MSKSTDADKVRPLPPLPPLPIKITDALRESHGFAEKSHWVIPNILMQGTRPGFGLDANDTSALSEQVRTLVRDAGCRTFVSLQAESIPETGSALLDEGGFRKPNPKDLPPYAALVSSVVNDITSDDDNKPQFLYYGIVGMQTAQSIDSLSNAITDLTAKIKTGETGGVYVHCGGGVGRAGLVCASVLGALYPTISADEAMEYTTGLCYLRCEEGKQEGVHYSSPETEDQKEQVRELFAKIRGGKE